MTTTLSPTAQDIIIKDLMSEYREHCQEQIRRAWAKLTDPEKLELIAQTEGLAPDSASAKLTEKLLPSKDRDFVAYAKKQGRKVTRLDTGEYALAD